MDTSSAGAAPERFHVANNSLASGARDIRSAKSLGTRPPSSSKAEAIALQAKTISPRRRLQEAIQRPLSPSRRAAEDHVGAAEAAPGNLRFRCPFKRCRRSVAPRLSALLPLLQGSARQGRPGVAENAPEAADGEESGLISSARSASAGYCVCKRASHSWARPGRSVATARHALSNSAAPTKLCVTATVSVRFKTACQTPAGTYITSPAS